MKDVEALAPFHPAVREWFSAAFPAPTSAQARGWAAIAKGESTLLLAPTGSGKTLAAFLWCLNRLMFDPPPGPKERCRVLYISPLKALAVDVERNLRAPIAGITNAASRRGDAFLTPEVLVRTGDTPASERARFQRSPADIVITTPESVYLMLTSNARDVLRSVDTVIIDEIHALVPTKRGAHLALSLERLEALAERPIQRIGLSATQRPLDEVARFLGGRLTGKKQTLRPIEPAPGNARKKAPAKPTRQTRASSARAVRAAAIAEGGEGGGSAADIAAHEIHEEFADHSNVIRYRPVTVVDAGARKTIELRIEVPVEDMAQLSKPVDIPSGPASQGPVRPSIWTAIHPRLLDLVRQHRSTLIFVNNRRSAERLSAALNELAGDPVPLVRAHHGSLARPQRVEIEDSLKAGTLRGLVATSSLELGIDMGAIDLVVQIEAPPSVASGLQRIGRAGHQVGAVSSGIIFPKYRGDLIACAAAARSMHEGHVEATRYPRNPLDVLAQQIVAMTAMDRWLVDDLFDAIRRAAPFAELDRSMFDGVLDMLAGRYPSDEFAELRPRVTWDRVKHTIVAREGAKRVAIANGGTIPDRGLYGVFLSGGARGGARVGELDEEMVFESRPGETFLLGASTWRIEEITHDRVIVTPAPGEPGKMPFWRGESIGRPLEFGRSIGALIRALLDMSTPAALDRLESKHGLDRQAAENLLQYLADQKRATGQVPDDQTVVIERTRDELGDWRVCLLTPFGGQILAPWSMAILAKIREETGQEAETLWTDEGLVIRLPESDEAPDPAMMMPDPDDVERLVLRQLGSTSLFAAKFREAAARALLLPRRRIGGRTPLWQQRKRAADLLAVAARFGSFPMVLEAYRESLRDVFDMPALVSTLKQIRSRQLRVVTVDSPTPSPFAASLLFGYVANYIYDGDAPLAERRAQALSIDHAQLKTLLGDAELRELLDAAAIEAVEQQVRQLDPTRRVKSADGLHDLLLRLGDLSEYEIARRIEPQPIDATDATGGARESAAPGNGAATTDAARAGESAAAGRGAAEYSASLASDYAASVAADRVARGDARRGGRGAREGAQDVLSELSDALEMATRRRAAARLSGELIRDRRAVKVTIASEPRLVAVEDAARYRDALGTPLPLGLPEAFLAPVRDPLGDLLMRYARSHGPFTAAEIAGRFGLGRSIVEPVLRRLVGVGRLLEGDFRPGGTEREWCEPGVLGQIRRRSLAKLRSQVEPVEPAVLGRLVTTWQGLTRPRKGLDALLAAGEVVWCGLEPLGERDGRVALYLTDHFLRLWRPPALNAPPPPQPLVRPRRDAPHPSRAPQGAELAPGVGAPLPASGAREALPSPSLDLDLGEREQEILAFLQSQGASFFGAIHEAVGGGFPNETVDALWTLVWRGLITNDAWHALRAYVTSGGDKREQRRRSRASPLPALPTM